MHFWDCKLLNWFLCFFFFSLSFFSKSAVEPESALMSFEYVLLDLMQHHRFHVISPPAALLCRKVTIIPIAPCDVVENYTRPPRSCYQTNNARDAGFQYIENYMMSYFHFLQIPVRLLDVYGPQYLCDGLHVNPQPYYIRMGFPPR